MIIQEFELLPEPKKLAAYLDFLRYENAALKKDVQKLEERVSELEQELQEFESKVPET
ncbi:hypothetical protein SAMN05444851_0111 [Aliiroseovarius sediminilitoris]|uniref:Uncharacterized protein n=1 Tax=Aliiroseovarius sediminilitoris TaxID=1173584 RepID=A0A1I0MKB6_9RHOB|nr:hypothetical protein [Aliiroseovarius sediminilitoris]SEV88797.1 hypothetical protein SAMN05444851_0111 [Aliiroseovarius sediminilitoris]